MTRSAVVSAHRVGRGVAGGGKGALFVRHGPLGSCRAATSAPAHVFRPIWSLGGGGLTAGINGWGHCPACHRRLAPVAATPPPLPPLPPGAGR